MQLNTIQVCILSEIFVLLLSGCGTIAGTTYDVPLLPRDSVAILVLKEGYDEKASWVQFTGEDKYIQYYKIDEKVKVPVSRAKDGCYLGGSPGREVWVDLHDCAAIELTPGKHTVQIGYFEPWYEVRSREDVVLEFSMQTGNIYRVRANLNPVSKTWSPYIQDITGERP